MSSLTITLTAFLKATEEMLEKLDHLDVCVSDETGKDRLATWRRGMPLLSARRLGLGCVICGDERHRGKIFFCKPGEKLEAVEELGAMQKILTYCSRGGSSDHHFFLCLVRKVKNPRKWENPAAEDKRSWRRKRKQCPS